MVGLKRIWTGTKAKCWKTSQRMALVTNSYIFHQSDWKSLPDSWWCRELSGCRCFREKRGKKRSGLVAFKASGQSFMLLLHSTDAQGFREIDAFWLFLWVEWVATAAESSSVSPCPKMPNYGDVMERSLPNGTEVMASTDSNYWFFFFFLCDRCLFIFNVVTRWKWRSLVNQIWV